MFRIILKQLREDAGLSQAQLAKIIGVSQSTIGMWESGKNKPEHSYLLKLSEYFNVSIDYLVGKSDIKEMIAADEDEELAEYLEELKHNEGMRMLFKAAKGAKKEDYKSMVDMIEIMKKMGGGDGA
ncbi:MAG: helix-turn-helix domain-containing protein [Acutalibacteraceae bacterium]